MLWNFAQKEEHENLMLSYQGNRRTQMNKYRLSIREGHLKWSQEDFWCDSDEKAKEIVQVKNLSRHWSLAKLIEKWEPAYIVAEKI